MHVISLLLIILSLQTVTQAIGTTCLTSSDCRGGEQCISDTCQCSANQISYNGRCLMNNNICTNGEQIYFNGRCLRTVSINGQCETSSQCIGGSACFNSFCTCPTGTTISNGVCQVRNGNCSPTQIYYQNQCYNLASIGQQCIIAAQCIGGSTCTNSVCQCPAGTTLVGQVCITGSGGSTDVTCPNTQVLVNGACLQRVSPGQSCQNSLQCFDGAECSTGNVCLCPTGMYITSGFCRKFSSDDPCDQTTAVYINNQCFNVRTMGSSCQYSLQCLGGTECINGICSCPSGTTAVSSYCIQTTTYCSTNQVLFNNRCYNTVMFGQSCLINEQCPDSAECGYSAICTCPYGTQFINNRCLRSQDSSCSVNEVLVNGVCYQYATPNGVCTYSQQCLGDSSCTNGICQCLQNNILTLNSYCTSSSLSLGCNQNYVYVNGQCLAYAYPGWQCSYAAQCLGGSVCTNNMCTCPNGYTQLMNYYCVRSQSTSVNCASNEIYINGQCYQLRTINEYCLYNQQCQHGTTCQNNYCYCPSGYTWQGSQCVTSSSSNCGTNQVYINGLCYSIAYIGQNCQYSQQCQDGSTCLNGFCQCPSGWIQQGSTCVYNGGNTGNCGSNQVSINGICYSISNIGQACQYTQQCQGGSTCVQGFCQCNTNQVVSNNMCVSNGGQMCSVGQVYVGGQCLAQVQIGQFCYYGEQCLGNSNCTLNKCTCPSGTVVSNNVCVGSSGCRSYQVLVNGQCLDTVSIGMQCTDSSQCIVSASCVQTSGSLKTCQCNSGTTYFGSACSSASSYCPYNTVYVSNTNCAQLVSLGGSCTYTSQCMGYSACTGGICQCPYSFQNVNGVCRSSSSL